jgi:hypothetical protein
MGTSARLVAVVAAVTVVVTGVSLVITSGIAFDPEAWIVWARESVGSGSLNTVGGPAWKPLPVLLIAPFTWISRGQADVYYWLLIARAGAVLAVFGVAALAHRFAGRTAAILAALLVVVSPWWFYNGVLGNAEPLMVALLAWAVLAYDAGKLRVAAVLLVAASMLRPEIWPFGLAFGAWLSYQDRRRIPWFAAAVVVVLVAWTIPELLHTGSSALSAARGKATDTSARYAAIPFLEVFKDAFDQLTPPAGVLVLLGLGTIAVSAKRTAGSKGVRALLAERNQETLIAAIGVLYVGIVAVMTQGGFAGNPRYLIPGLAALTVVAGVTGARIATSLQQRAGARILATDGILSVGVTAIVVAVALASQLGTLRTQLTSVSGHAQLANTMKAELAALRCPRVVWTFAANRSTLAQLADQSVDQSTHPAWFRMQKHRFVYCAPRSWHGQRDN